MRCLPADLEGAALSSGLLTVTADNAAVPQVLQKDDQELRKALTGYADQSDQPYRKSAQAQNDDAGGQPKRKEQKKPVPDGKHQDAGLNHNSAHGTYRRKRCLFL